jgi:hypothetical protein
MNKQHFLKRVRRVTLTITMVFSSLQAYGRHDRPYCVRVVYCGSGLDEMAVDPMDVEELKTRARYQVGDEVWMEHSGSRPWRITARYWSRRRGCIVYDLCFEYNGLTLDKVEEERLYTERQWNGTTVP